MATLARRQSSALYCIALLMSYLHLIPCIAAISTTTSSFDFESAFSSVNAVLSSIVASKTVSAPVPTAPTSTDAPNWETTDPSFAINSANWKEALPFYAKFTIDHREEIKAHPEGEWSYFLQHYLPNSDVQCGVDLPQCGCDWGGAGLLDHLDSHITSRDDAKNVYFTMLSVQAFMKSNCAIIHGFRDASTDLWMLGETFAETFFPQRDKWAMNQIDKCKHDSLMTGALVATALVLGTALFSEAIIAFGPMLFAEGMAILGVTEKAVERATITAVDGVAEAEAGAPQLLMASTFKEAGKTMGETTVRNSWGKFATDYTGKVYGEDMENHCGVDVPKDNRLKDMGELGRWMQDQVSTFATGWSASMRVLLKGHGTGPDGAYKDGEPSALAQTLKQKLPKFEAFKRVHDGNVDGPAITNDLRHRLTAVTIQHFWHNQHCMLQCTDNQTPGNCDVKDKDGNVVHHPQDQRYQFCPKPFGNEAPQKCQAVCWVDGENSVLYPLFGHKKLSTDPWNLELEQIVQTSYDLFMTNPTVSFKAVANSQILAWRTKNSEGNVTVPLLQVAKTPFTRIQEVNLYDHESARWLPCSVGGLLYNGRYGGLSRDSWNYGGWKYVKERTYYASICRDNFNLMMGGDHHREPGTFYINMCMVLNNIAYPHFPEIAGQDDNPWTCWDDPRNCRRAVEFVHNSGNLQRWSDQGKSEQEVMCIINSFVCERKENKGGFPSRQVNGGACQSRDDFTNINEGYCRTREYRHDACKNDEWRNKCKSQGFSTKPKEWMQQGIQRPPW